MFTVAVHYSQKARGERNPHIHIDRYMDRQNVLHTYNGILFSLKKEICHTRILYDSTYIMYLRWSKSYKVE